MAWHDAAAKEHREAVIENRAWVYTIFQYTPGTDEREIIGTGVFDVVRARYNGGLREAQEHVVEIARSHENCKRVRKAREALDPEAIAWLEARLLDTLQTSYARWRENVARLRRDAEAGDRNAQEALYYERSSGRPLYPEPKWTVGRLANETAQYHLPDELDVLTDKRLYETVRAALERLKRRRLATSSTGIDDRGREAKLWEPV